MDSLRGDGTSASGTMQRYGTIPDGMHAYRRSGTHVSRNSALRSSADIPLKVAGAGLMSPSEQSKVCLGAPGGREHTQGRLHTHMHKQAPAARGGGVQEEGVGERFFEALERVRVIHRNCRELLRGRHQRAGLELMDAMALHQEAAYERLCRRACRRLPSSLLLSDTKIRPDKVNTLKHSGRLRLRSFDLWQK